MVQCPAGQLAGYFMRFSIRDLLGLMVVAALAVLLWVSRTSELRTKDEMAKLQGDLSELRKLHESVLEEYLDTEKIRLEQLDKLRWRIRELEQPATHNDP